MRLCPHCGKPTTLKHYNFAEYKKRKSDNARRSLLKRKANGGNIGRPLTWDRDKIIELHKQGLSMSEIVGVVKCSKATVFRVIKKLKESQGE